MAKSEENQVTVTTTMSKAYQITVPSVVRKMLGLMPGDTVDFRLGHGRAELVRVESHEERVKRLFAELDEWREGLPEETKLEIKKHAGWTANQYREYIDNLPETKAYIKEKYGV